MSQEISRKEVVQAGGVMGGARMVTLSRSVRVVATGYAFIIPALIVYVFFIVSLVHLVLLQPHQLEWGKARKRVCRVGELSRPNSRPAAMGGTVPQPDLDHPGLDNAYFNRTRAGGSRMEWGAGQGGLSDHLFLAGSSIPGRGRDHLELDV